MVSVFKLWVAFFFDICYNSLGGSQNNIFYLIIVNKMLQALGYDTHDGTANTGLHMLVSTTVAWQPSNKPLNNTFNV